MAGHSDGWPWFAAWAVAGGLLFFSLLTGFSIGLFVLPFALLACWLLVVRARHWPEVLGGAAGVGLTCLGIAFANRGSSPCPSSGAGSVSAGDAAGSSFECGGLDPLPWLLAGSVLVALGVVAYALLGPSDRHHEQGIAG